LIYRSLGFNLMSTLERSTIDPQFSQPGEQARDRDNIGEAARPRPETPRRGQGDQQKNGSILISTLRKTDGVGFAPGISPGAKPSRLLEILGASLAVPSRERVASKRGAAPSSGSGVAGHDWPMRMPMDGRHPRDAETALGL
jgi:hypothetical protein